MKDFESLKKFDITKHTRNYFVRLDDQSRQYLMATTILSLQQIATDLQKLTHLVTGPVPSPEVKAACKHYEDTIRDAFVNVTGREPW